MISLYKSSASNGLLQATASICCAKTSVLPILSISPSIMLFSIALIADTHSKYSNLLAGTNNAFEGSLNL